MQHHATTIAAALVASLGCASAQHGGPQGALARDEAPPCPDLAHTALRGVELRFEGNTALASAELQCALARHVADRPPPRWSDEGERTEFVRTLHDVALAAYYDHGYLTAEVAPGTAEVGAEGATPVVRLGVTHEGPRLRVGVMRLREVDGDGREVEPLGGREALRARLRFHPGDWFSRSVVARSLLDIQHVYRDAGYAFVQVSPDVETHLEQGTVDVSTRVVRGPVVTVGRIDVGGPMRIPREAVLAQVHPAVGERYNETALEASRRALLDAHAAGHVDLSNEALPDHRDQVVVHVDLRE